MNLRSYDGNDNENVKKKNTNSAFVSHFLRISLPPLHDYEVTFPNFTRSVSI